MICATELVGLNERYLRVWPGGMVIGRITRYDQVFDVIKHIIRGPNKH
jgi:hypothetical protein